MENATAELARCMRICVGVEGDLLARNGTVDATAGIGLIPINIRLGNENMMNLRTHCGQAARNRDDNIGKRMRGLVELQIL